MAWLRQFPSKVWLRFTGFGFVIVLLWQIDTARLLDIVSLSNQCLILLAICLNLLMVFIKTSRWWFLMVSQNITYPIWQAYLVYFSSIFIGFLTPGRLGEFARALYIRLDKATSTGQALSSVLVDRLFDLSLLIIIGSIAFISIAILNTWQFPLIVLFIICSFSLGLTLFLSEQGFNLTKRVFSLLGPAGQKLFAPDSLGTDLRTGLKQIPSTHLALSAILTILAYLIFFGQCYLLALALHLPVTFLSVTFAVALGSLVTLIPISISGIGTRDAAIVTYLSTLDISSEAALSFSILVFITFYLSGGLIGAGAWLIKPMPLSTLRTVAS